MTAFEENQSEVYLPHEVLSEIFEYLPYIDRKNASLVCKHWYSVLLDHKFVMGECINFDHISYLSNKSEILNVFINSSRRYHNVIVKDCEINSPQWLEFFQKYADDIHFLLIDRCDVSEKTFVQVIQILRNLHKLELNCNNQLLMSGGLFKGEADISRLSLPRCEQLELVSNRYLSDRIIHDFFSLCPHVRHLSLKNSNISFHGGLYKRFYPERLVNSFGTEDSADGSVYRSDTVLTFVHILASLASRASTLVSLDLSFTLVNNEALAQLATLAGLRLRTVRLTSCEQVSHEGFAQLFQHQSSLTEIDVSSCSRLIDRSVHTLCLSCTELRELKMRNCSGITDLSCKELSLRLRQLTVLDISHCNQISGDGISSLFSASHENLIPTSTKSSENRMITKPKNSRLKCLIFSGINIVPREFQPVVRHCCDLRILDLSHCFTMVSDETLLAIFQSCTMLTELSLASCEAITDWGLIGLRSQDLRSSEPNTSFSNGQSSAEFNNSSPSSVQSNSSSCSPFKMFLGSRAELEILNDAQRKLSALNVMRKSPSLELRDHTTDLFGLNRVKGLTKLNLSGCNKISDASLIYALCHVPFLQYLHLGDVQQISSEGIQAICHNNFRIHELKLRRCFNLQDADVASLASRLKTLQHLDVSSCNRLTDSSLASLSLHCTSLKSLNLQKCPLVSPGAIDDLAASLSSLHTILSPSATSLESAGPAPPAPPLIRSGAIRRN